MIRTETTVTDASTRQTHRASRSRGGGLVAFLFGLAGRPELPGVTLRRMLADLEVSPDAARSLLARMVREDQLTSRRDGRTTTYALAGAFAAGWERVRDQAMTRPVPWPGHFHALLHTVPETHRGFRDQLRRAAVLAGYGVLQPGVLIALTDRSQALTDVLAAAPPDARIRRATLGMTRAEAADAASVAWGLPDLAARFHAHVAAMDPPAPAPGPGAFRAFVDVLQPALTDTLREPALEPDLMPPGWPGPMLRTALGRYQRAHEPVLAAYRDEVLRGG